MASMSDAPVGPGDTLAGKYRVERVLGQGAMGVVVAARHISLGQLVAVKFMLPGKAPRPEQQERFLREARAAAQLKSHHVAHVLDMGTLENGAPYTVMEFLEGKDLSALLEERKVLPLEEAVEYILQACEAMSEAHAAGIVHRDLKPANLFVIRDVSGSPCVKVLDFGISKLSGALTLTQESQALGSPLYMSPEQMNSSKGVDARSDIWALGVVLYELIAGRTPFDSDTIQELCGRVFVGQPTPLRTYWDNAPPELEAVILRCLEKDPQQRWQNVADFVSALAPYAPAHARVYADRVARVLGGKAPSSPDIAPRRTSAEPPPFPPPFSPPRGAATVPGEPMADPRAPAARPEQQKTELFVGSHPAMVLSRSSAGSEPALSPTKLDPARPEATTGGRTRPSAGWGILIALAIVAITVPVAVYMALRQPGPNADPLPGRAASMASPVQPSEAPVAVAPPGSGIGIGAASTGAEPSGSGPRAAASSSAPAVAPLPPGPSRSPGRATGGVAAVPSPKVTAQPASSPGPTPQPTSSRGIF
jgi:serine/threonine protein kinase